MTSNQQLRSRPPRPRTGSGVALVIVLSFLVLTSVLVLAFFSSVSSEGMTTKAYSNSSSANLLADSAMNIVMGQIAKATKGQNSTGDRMTWASQPGMIRTFTTQESADECFKLYSSSQMVVPGADVQAALVADVPPTWKTQPAIYTDLNAPVMDSKGTANFPILDGDKLGLLSVAGSNVLTYKPLIGATPEIEGYAVLPSAVPDYKPGSSATATNNSVPMPVQWIYVLKDGAMVGADSGGDGNTATFKDAKVKDPKSAPSQSNPIVGRIAFWTDDETCKLNLNTASEGTFFAPPHTASPMDMQSLTKTSSSGTAGFAVSPPATGEYNRYPGHPATTCLSVALGTWLDQSSGKTAPNAYTSSGNDSAYLTGLNNYLKLLPKVGTGGSKAGTVLASSVAGSITTVTTPTNRLLASVDELIFDPLRNPNSYLSGSATRPLTRAMLEKTRFFLTTSSRSPELTPFNTPKVSLWPQWSLDADRTARSTVTKRLLGFCSSFGAADPTDSPSGKNEYFFQRYSHSANSRVSCTDDWDKVPRNQKIANYLCNLGNKPIPGYGAAFRDATNKYSDLTFSNIVLESLDYIRSCVIRSDYTLATGYGSNASGVNLQIYPLKVTSGLPGVTASNAIKGFGFYPAFSQVVLGVGNTAAASAAQPNYVPCFVFQNFDPTSDLPGSNANVSIRFSDLQNVGINGPVADPSAPVTYIDAIGSLYNDNKPNPMRVIAANLSGCRLANTTPSTPTTPASATIGGTLPVKIEFIDRSGQPFQTFSIIFPPVTLPLEHANPNPPAPPAQPKPWLPLTTTSMPNGNGNIGPAGAFFNGAYHCLARGMESSGTSGVFGDHRLLASIVNLDTATMPGVLKQSAGYGSTDLQAHSLYINCGAARQPIVVGGITHPPTTALTGSLVAALANTDYEDFLAPYIPVGVTGARNFMGRPGDWDTGPNVYSDGPYINPVAQSNTVGLSPYYDWYNGMGPQSNAATFSPNRRIASALQFGSLPTGVGIPLSNAQRPWQTLLFCPNPAARSTPPNGTPSGSTEHPGFANPPDHMFLEFFTMPVVEPYAISEPLSTAGKVNLNYQLAPFTYIERSTALRGVLKNTLMAGICGYDVKPADTTHPTPAGTAVMYKGRATGGNLDTWTNESNKRYPNEIRYDINRDATLAGIQKYYFNKGKIFRYPSEICDVFLVPKKLAGATYHSKAALPPTLYDNTLAWWNPIGAADPLSVMSLTGDNLREEPYSRIYPRVTTQSNVFTVHCRVQVLQKRSNSDPESWVEGKDVIGAEHRGSSMIERYLDPSDPQLDRTWDNDTIALNLTGKADLSRLFKFRVINTKKFAP